MGLDGVEHGEDVIEGGFGEDGVVTGAGDVTAAGHHDVEDLASFGADGVGGAANEDVMGIDGTVEEDLMANSALRVGRSMPRQEGWMV